MSDGPLEVSITNDVMTIRFKRPHALNAVTPEMFYGLDAAIDRVQKEAHAVIQTGDEGSFCSGADLGEQTTLKVPSRSARKVTR